MNKKDGKYSYYLLVIPENETACEHESVEIGNFDNDAQAIACAGQKYTMNQGNLIVRVVARTHLIYAPELSYVVED